MSYLLNIDLQTPNTNSPQKAAFESELLFLRGLRVFAILLSYSLTALIFSFMFNNQRQFFSSNLYEFILVWLVKIVFVNSIQLYIMSNYLGY